MTRKRTPRWSAMPPAGLCPKLKPDQVRDLSLCHNEHLDAIAKGTATEATLWQFVGGTLTWSKVAELLHLGEPEIARQLDLAMALIARHGRTGRVLFTGSEYQLAKEGVLVMDQLAEIVDRHTAIAAAEWSERRLNDLEAGRRRAQPEAA